MKSALSGSLVAGIKTCGEVFFCIPDADVVEGGDDGVTGFSFEHAVQVVKITVKHPLYRCAVDVLAVVGSEVVPERYDISASARVGSDGVGETSAVVKREHGKKLAQQTPHHV